jgi:hypothetical protein
VGWDAVVIIFEIVFGWMGMLDGKCIS